MKKYKFGFKRISEYDLAKLEISISELLKKTGISYGLKGKRILLKPNCTGVYDPAEGMTTHPIFVEASIKVLRQFGAIVMIGESSSVGTDTKRAYTATGISEICNKLGVEMIDFKKSSYVKIKIDSPKAVEIIQLPKPAVDADFVVSLAKIKTNYTCTMGCSIKNMKGLLKDSQKMEFHHSGIAESMIDLYSAIRNNLKTFAIVDGIIASELYSPRKASMIAVSDELFICDYICSHIMAVPIRHVSYLCNISSVYYKDIDLKSLDLRNIDLFGDALVTLHPGFRYVPLGTNAIADEFGIKIIDSHACSACIGTLYRALKKISKTRPDMLRDICIAIGKGDWNMLPDACRKHGKIMGYGNCSASSSRFGYAKGCPPTANDLISALEDCHIDHKTDKMRIKRQR